MLTCATLNISKKHFGRLANRCSLTFSAQAHWFKFIFFPESEPHVLQSAPPFMHKQEHKDGGTLCAWRKGHQAAVFCHVCSEIWGVIGSLNEGVNESSVCKLLWTNWLAMPLISNGPIMVLFNYFFCCKFVHLHWNRRNNVKEPTGPRNIWKTEKQMPLFKSFACFSCEILLLYWTLPALSYFLLALTNMRLD